MDIYNCIRLLWGRTKGIAHQGPRDEDNSQKSQEEPPPILRAELQIPQSVIERYDAQQSDEAKSKKRRERFEMMTLFTGVFGLLALLATLYETRRATNAVIESAHLDKRAWVGIGNIQLLGEMVAGQPLGLKVFLRNSGESPAVHVSSEGILSLLKSVGEPREVPFMKLPNFNLCVDPKPQWDEVSGGAVIVPGVDAPNLSYLSQALPKKYVELIRGGKGVSVSPGDAEEFGEMGEIPTAPGIPSDNTSLYVGLYFVGCINYFDASHIARRTSFCFRHFYNPALATLQPNGGFTSCDWGNDAD